MHLGERVGESAVPVRGPFEAILENESPDDLRVLDKKALSGAGVSLYPYSHFTAAGVIRKDAAPNVLADYPEIKVSGTVAADDVALRGAFADLIADLHNPVVSRLMSEKLGLDLTSRPIFINMCSWCKAGDGQIHTDSESKLATLLIYFNETWTDDGSGCFRILRGDRDFEDYACEIKPLIGNAVGFRRSDHSWHGFKPFVGQRRMVQTTWLVDGSTLARKRRAGRRAHWLRRLNPFAA